MLNQQITRLHDALGLNGKDIAKYAGFSAPFVSNLKNGTKAPKKDSPTMQRYIDAVCRLSDDTGKHDQLAALLGIAPDIKGERLRLLLMDWLYPQTGLMLPDADPDTFSGNLRRIMACLDLSGIELAALTNISKSHMARIINNENEGLPDDGKIKLICSALIAETANKKSQVAICHLLGCSIDIVLNERDYMDRLRTWLCYPANTPNPDITGLLLKMRELPLPSGDKPLSHDTMPGILTMPDREQAINADMLPPIGVAGIPKKEDIPQKGEAEGTEDVYYGTKGLQKAVVRFLATALHAQRGLPAGKTGLYLYSDQSMDWMVEPVFHARWASLMAECVQSGIHIKLIHNIDRSMPEMMEAIKSWMPLYMSGMIEPYYSKRTNGDSFSHTLFLSPLRACISAMHTTGFEPNGIYRYDTDKKLLRQHKKMFSMMLRNSRPLLRVTLGQPDPKIADSLIHPENLPGIGISVNSAAAVVVKEGTPQTVFSFYHPLMKKAFQAYVRTLI